MAKMSIIFDGFDTLAEQLDEITRDIKPAVNEALTETQQILASNLTKASQKYASKGGGKGYATGQMYKSIITDKKVEWKGTEASIHAGFKLSKAWESIFIMYGTPRRVKSQLKKDVQVFNAIKGTKTKKDIADLQKKIMQKYIALGGKG